MLIDLSLIRSFFVRDSLPQDIDKVWRDCPNRMLWEAIRAEDAAIISHEEIRDLVKQATAVCVLPEPLPAFHQNQQAAYTLVSSPDFLDGFSQYTKMEPLYLFCNDFSWMVVFTTENTPNGKQLCIFVKNLHSK